MASGISNFLLDELLDLSLGDGTYAQPANVYLALFTVAPDAGAGGTEVTTSSWTNYSRVDIVNNATNWPVAVNGAKSNGAAFSFGAATVTGAAVTVVGWALYDADTAGNRLYFGTLTTSKTVNDGDTPSVAIGELDITITNTA